MFRIHILSELLPCCYHHGGGGRAEAADQTAGQWTSNRMSMQESKNFFITQSCQSKVWNCKTQFECARSTTIASEHHSVDGEVECALSNVFDLSQNRCFIFTHRWKTSVWTSGLWPAGESRTWNASKPNSPVMFYLGCILTNMSKTGIKNPVLPSL